MGKRLDRWMVRKGYLSQEQLEELQEREPKPGLQANAYRGILIAVLLSLPIWAVLLWWLLA